MGTAGIYRCISSPILQAGVFLFFLFLVSKKKKEKRKKKERLVAGCTSLDISHQ